MRGKVRQGQDEGEDETGAEALQVTAAVKALWEAGPG